LLLSYTGGLTQPSEHTEPFEASRFNCSAF
jgi:hypothetical protein